MTLIAARQSAVPYCCYAAESSVRLLQHRNLIKDESLEIRRVSLEVRILTADPLLRK